MAMAPAQGRGGRKKRRLNAEINVVPYIDVMLVLLVIFMVTAPLLTQGIDVELPQTSSNPLSNQDEPITMNVDASGRYYLNIGTDTSKPLTDDELTQRIHAVMDQKPETMILVGADKSVPYDKVIQGMSLLQAAGAKKIGFITSPGGGKTGKHTP
jgi:biopolymer transport protein TolR